MAGASGDVGGHGWTRREVARGVVGASAAVLAGPAWARTLGPVGGGGSAGRRGGQDVPRDWARETLAMVDRMQGAFWRPGRDGKPGMYAADGAVSDAVRGGVDGRPELWGFTLWSGVVAWHALVMAARLAPAGERGERVAAVRDVYRGLERYWNGGVSGYACWLCAPGTKAGEGPQVFYDDNAWMVITLVDAHAVTGERAYLERAEVIAEGLLWAGWREDRWGGVPWVVPTKADPGGGGRNACTNAGSAVAMLKLRGASGAAKWLERAVRLTAWVVERLVDKDGLVMDGLDPEAMGDRAAGRIERTKWTYNTGTTIRALALLAEAGRAAGDAARGEGHRPQDAGGVLDDPLGLARRMATAATDRAGALYDRSGPDTSRRWWYDSTFFVQHLAEGLAELDRVSVATGGRAGFGTEVRRHAAYVRDELVDGDGLAFRGMRLWRIDGPRLERWRELQPAAGMAYEPDGAERSTAEEELKKGVGERTVVKTLLGSAGAAKLFAVAAGA